MPAQTQNNLIYNSRIWKSVSTQNVICIIFLATVLVILGGFQLSNGRIQRLVPFFCHLSPLGITGTLTSRFTNKEHPGKETICKKLAAPCPCGKVFQSRTTLCAWNAVMSFPLSTVNRDWFGWNSGQLSGWKPSVPVSSAHLGPEHCTATNSQHTYPPE